MPVGDEARPFDEDRGAGSERCERLFGLGDELPQSHLCPHRAKHADHGRLARPRILAGRFADERGIAFEIEKIVGVLECLADRRSIALERATLQASRRSEHAAGHAGEAQQRAGFHRLQHAHIVLAELLRAVAGFGGMAGGQMLDLAAEGRFAGNGPQQLGEDDVRTLQAMKTGALLRFACAAGGMLGSATLPQRRALERYGSAVGQAFQIADDILDLEGDPALVGKQTGKDAVAGKATMVGVLGGAGAKARLRQLVAEAEQALAPFGPGATILIEGARFVADRHA